MHHKRSCTNGKRFYSQSCKYQKEAFISAPELHRSVKYRNILAKVPLSSYNLQMETRGQNNIYRRGTVVENIFYVVYIILMCHVIPRDMY